MWTNTDCFDFCYVIFYILSQLLCAKLHTFRIRIYISLTKKLLLYLSRGKHYLSHQMCSNTIQKQVIMNINNQDTFLELYYASNVISRQIISIIPGSTPLAGTCDMSKQSVFCSLSSRMLVFHLWVCNCACIEAIFFLYIRLHTQNIKTVSSCPHYHTATRKIANYNI